MNIKGCFLHSSDDWKTPPEIYDYFIQQGYIDPCPFKAEFDGLKIIHKDKKVFINPPYSKLKIWTEYAIKLWQEGCKVVLLIPSRTETKYFQELLKYNPKLFFFKGRLHFNESKNCAPFPSCLMVLQKGMIYKEYSTIGSIKDLEKIS